MVRLGCTFLGEKYDQPSTIGLERTSLRYLAVMQMHFVGISLAIDK